MLSAIITHNMKLRDSHLATVKKSVREISVLTESITYLSMKGVLLHDKGIIEHVLSKRKDRVFYNSELMCCDSFGELVSTQEQIDSLNWI